MTTEKDSALIEVTRQVNLDFDSNPKLAGLNGYSLKHLRPLLIRAKLSGKPYSLDSLIFQATSIAEADPDNPKWKFVPGKLREKMASNNLRGRETPIFDPVKLEEFSAELPYESLSLTRRQLLGNLVQVVAAIAAAGAISTVAAQSIKPGSPFIDFMGIKISVGGKNK